MKLKHLLFGFCAVVVAIAIVGTLLAVFLPGTGITTTTLRHSTMTTTKTTSSYPITSSSAIITPNYTKLLVATGTQDETTGMDSVEVIDLGDPNKTCNDLPSYPVPVRGACGFIGLDEKPVVLAGRDDSNFNQPNYILNMTRWTQSYDFRDQRSYFAASPISVKGIGQTHIVSGGLNQVPLPNYSTETFSKAGWTLFVFLPTSVYVHCMVQLNVSAVMVIAGRQGLYYLKSNNTWIYNDDIHNWLQGPDYVLAISSHSCGMVKTNNQTESKSAIVIGGLIANATMTDIPIADVNLLDEGASAWRPGPTFPHVMFSTAVVEDPSGGVLAVGGRNDYTSPLSTIYHLATADSKWVLLPQKLKEARFSHVAFLIPDELGDSGRGLLL